MWASVDDAGSSVLRCPWRCPYVQEKLSLVRFAAVSLELRLLSLRRPSLLTCLADAGRDSSGEARRLASTPCRWSATQLYTINKQARTKDLE